MRHDEGSVIVLNDHPAMQAPMLACMCPSGGADCPRPREGDTLYCEHCGPGGRGCEEW
jgi:hypothetical protein